MLPTAVALITCLWLHSQQQVFHFVLDDAVQGKLGESKQNTALRYQKHYRCPTAFCWAEMICYGNRLNSWKAKESLLLKELQRWRQLIKHIDQLAGLLSGRLISGPDGTASSTEHCLSEEQWRFLLKMCARGGRKHEKKAFSYQCSTYAHFLTIPECALRHSQPLQHCHPSQHTPGTPHSATMIFADRPSWKPSHYYWLNLSLSYKL